MSAQTVTFVPFLSLHFIICYYGGTDRLTLGRRFWRASFHGFFQASEDHWHWALAAFLSFFTLLQEVVCIQSCVPHCTLGTIHPRFPLCSSSVPLSSANIFPASLVGRAWCFPDLTLRNAQPHAPLLHSAKDRGLFSRV